ncbi:MAG: MBL fold metallo-hydrolase [Eubacteriales bacterium]|nr:MBL fold metallo-hydrolase [Eubacteriales bacterium]
MCDLKTEEKCVNIYSFDPIDSRLYYIVMNDMAIIVDPCVSWKMFNELTSKGVKCATIILTHEHYDHISGVNWFRENFENVSVLCSKKCSQMIMNAHKNLSAFSNVLYMDKEMDKSLEEYGWDLNYTCYADETFEDEMEFDWEGHHFFLKETPGHSPGSICIIMDNKYLFSGDTLVTGHPTITRLPGGSKKEFKEITIPYLKTLNPELMVYPGHGEPQKLKEFNL